MQIDYFDPEWDGSPAISGDRLFRYLFANPRHRDWGLSLIRAFLPAAGRDPDPERYTISSGYGPLGLEAVLSCSDRSEFFRSACRPLEEYTWVVNDIRSGISHGLSLTDAIRSTLERIPRNFVTREELLRKPELTMAMLEEDLSGVTEPDFPPYGRKSGAYCPT